MSLSLVSTFGSAGSGWGLQENGSATSISISVTCHAVGDCVVVLGIQATGDAPTTGLADSNSLITWDSSPFLVNQSDGNGFAVGGWRGTIASTGTTSITGRNGDWWAAYACEINESLSASPTWTVVTSGKNFSTGTSVSFPNLTSGSAADQAYLGAMLLCGAGTVGSTGGFSYLRTTTDANILCWDMALATSTGYTPTCTNSGGAYDTLGVIISATTTAAFIAPEPKIIDQAVCRAVFY
jgi:hypothetical protein